MSSCVFWSKREALFPRDPSLPFNPSDYPIDPTLSLRDVSYVYDGIIDTFFDENGELSFLDTLSNKRKWFMLQQGKYDRYGGGHGRWNELISLVFRGDPQKVAKCEVNKMKMSYEEIQELVDKLDGLGADFTLLTDPRIRDTYSRYVDKRHEHERLNQLEQHHREFFGTYRDDEPYAVKRACSIALCPLWTFPPSIHHVVSTMFYSSYPNIEETYRSLGISNVDDVLRSIGCYPMKGGDIVPIEVHAQYHVLNGQQMKQLVNHVELNCKDLPRLINRYLFIGF
jgi:hypothetical protein